MSDKRKRLFHINKYQMRILGLVLVPPVIILSVLALMSNLFFDQLLAAVESGSPTTLVDFLSQWRVNVFVALWLLLTLVVVLTYVVSRNLVGAFTRIFREMDELLAGRREPRPITARKHDDLANELLERMNRLHGAREEKT